MRLAAPLAALLLAATACSSGSDPAETSAPRASSTPAAPAADPVRWSSKGSSCTELTGPMLMSDQVRFSRPVTVTGMSAVGLTGGLGIGRITIVAVPEGKIPVSGGWRGDRPGARWRDDLAWADREPIDGARVQRGAYYFFIPVDIGQVPARYDGFRLTWQDGSTSGSSTWQAMDVYRTHCR